MDDLPPGVPHVVDTNGEVLFVDTAFTTRAFQEEGLRLVIEEANKVVEELKLQEAQPLTKTNLVHAFVGPFGYTYRTKKLGNITTTNYNYGVEQGYKFSDLTVAKYDDRCREYYEKYQWPLKRLDTNSAYRLATQWLAAAWMDIKGLNRDCNVQVVLDSHWNGVEFGQLPKNKFTPLYYVLWSPKGNGAKSGGAQVELFLPTKTLLQLDVYDSKYILRSPVVISNLVALFPGKAEIVTNKPVPLQYISAPRP